MPLSITRDEPGPAGRGMTRRELLRIGGLGALGLTIADLARFRAQAGQRTVAKYRANSCVFIFLFGGPSHIDLWDMKPEAPAEIRGEFRPIDTAVPGIRLCEHLPLLARRMDLFCLLRSMTHHMPVHGPACSEIYSGRPYFGPPVTDQATPEDWPSIAAMVQRYGPKRAGWPPSIVIPWLTQFAGQDRPIAGQTGGRMGETFHPFLVKGDPSRRDFQVPGLELPEDVPLHRADARHALLRRLEAVAQTEVCRGPGEEALRDHYATAFSMLSDSSTAQAFALDREPRTMRERYGPHKFGQSLLLARRLIEAGISLVTVNWDDETATDKVSPFWDTHNHNFPALKDRLAPRFDRAFSAFLDDLNQRDLLEFDPGRGHRGIRPDAPDRSVRAERHDREDRPRPLAACLHGTARRRRGAAVARSTAPRRRPGDTSRTTRSLRRTSPQQSSITWESTRAGNTGIDSSRFPGSSPRAGPCATSDDGPDRPLLPSRAGRGNCPSIPWRDRMPPAPWRQRFRVG